MDNTLDTIATPAAAVAGAIAASSAVTDISPFLTWMIAIIGGGVASAFIFKRKVMGAKSETPA